MTNSKDKKLESGFICGNREHGCKDGLTREGDGLCDKCHTEYCNEMMEQSYQIERNDR